MKILLIAATEAEISPLRQLLEPYRNADAYQMQALRIRIVVTGVGLCATAWGLAHALCAERPDYALQIGICGAIDRRLALGEVLYVSREAFADLGAEDADGAFLNLYDLGLADPDTAPFRGGMLYNEPVSFLPNVTGISVQTVHGSETSIADLRRRFPDAQVESMEGAAFFYGCLQAGLPFAQLRAVSNYVEPRNRDRWQIPLAIANVNHTAWSILSNLEVMSGG